MATRIIWNRIADPVFGVGAVKGRPVSIRCYVNGSKEGGAFTADKEIVGGVGTTVKVDDTGYWEAELEVNDDLIPTGTYYSVKEPGGGPNWDIVVQAGDPAVKVRLLDAVEPTPTSSVPIQAGVSQAALDTAVAGLVPSTRTVNGKALSGNVTLSAADVGADTAGARDTAISAALTALLNGAPAALDTLKELADAIGDDASFAASITTALGGKVPTTRTVNGHALSADVTVTKSDVGLGSVDNTSDANKPVSTAQAAAIAAAINGLINGAPGTLDTLNEIATQLASDESAASSLTTLVTNLRTLADSTFSTNLDARYIRQVAAPTGITATDTAAIQGAIDAAATAGGAIVMLQAGTYVTTTLTIKPKVLLIGYSESGTVIQLAASQGTDLIIADGFASNTQGATGTAMGVAATPYGFTVSNLTLDGNSANQPTPGARTDHSQRSALLKIWGYGYTLRDIAIRDAKEVGLYTEHYGTWENSFSQTKLGEAVYSGIRIKSYGYAGWINRGPHDSTCAGAYISAYPVGGLVPQYGYIQENSGSLYSASGFMPEYLHVWGNHAVNAMLINGGSSVVGGFLYAEGSQGAALAINGGVITADAMVGYCTDGVDIISGNNQNLRVRSGDSITGALFKVRSTSGSRLEQRYAANPGGAVFDLAAYTGSKNTFISDRQYQGTLLTGTIATTDRLDLVQSGPTPSANLTRWELPVGAKKVRISNDATTIAALGLPSDVPSVLDLGGVELYGAGTGQTVLPPSGHYFFPVSPGGSSTANNLGIGTLRLARMFIPRSLQISAIGAEVTTIGDVGSKVRLVIYAEDGDTLILDAGQIAGDSATTQAITLGSALTLPRGYYFLGGVVQSVTTTQPTVRTVSTMADPGFLLSSGNTLPGAGAGTQGYSKTGVTAAAPASLGGISALSPSGVLPARLFLRRA